MTAKYGHIGQRGKGEKEGDGPGAEMYECHAPKCPKKATVYLLLFFCSGRARESFPQPKKGSNPVHTLFYTQTSSPCQHTPRSATAPLIALWTPPRASSAQSRSQVRPQVCHADEGARTTCLLRHGLGKLHEQSRWQSRHGHAQHAPQVGDTRAQEQREARVVAGPSAKSKAPHEEVAQCGAVCETAHLCVCRLAFLDHHQVPAVPPRKVVSGHTEDAL